MRRHSVSVDGALAGIVDDLCSGDTVAQTFSSPLANIDRWIADGHTAPYRLDEWRQLILHAPHPA